jgi:hypothetical protein
MMNRPITIVERWSFHLVPRHFEECSQAVSERVLSFFSGKILSLAKAFLSKKRKEKKRSAKVARSRNFFLP